jgi:DNA polymerase I-like protein with 3'-5' exonuclease and polymerase domains
MSFIRKVCVDLEWGPHDNLLIAGYRVFPTADGTWSSTLTSEGINHHLKLLLADESIVKVGQSKADWKWLRQHGYEVNGPLHDTMVMAWVLDENTPLGLDYLVKRYCGHQMDKRLSSVAGRAMFRCNDNTLVPIEDAPVDQLKAYNAGDVYWTAALYDTLAKRMETSGWWGYYEQEQVPFTRVLLEMELSGIPIDLEAADVLKQNLRLDQLRQVDKLDRTLGYPLRKRDGGPGYGSSTLLRNVLFEKVWYEETSVPHEMDMRKTRLIENIAEERGIKKSEVTPGMVDDYKFDLVDKYKPQGMTVQKVTPKNFVGFYTRRGYGLPPTPPSDPEAKHPQPTTAMPVLLTEFAGHDFVMALADWAKTRKVITTYLDAYPKFSKDDRLYGSFNQVGTKTGRISSARPNLMNQPAHGPLGKQIRELFKGNLIVGDYGQLEPRLLAHFSQDPKLLEVYAEGLDIYAVTAAGVFGGKPQDYDEKHPKRKMAKPLFLGDQYGAGYKKLTMLLRLNGFDVSHDEVKRFQDRMHATFGVAQAWKENVVRVAKQKGYVVTLDGHRRRLDSQFKDRNWKNRGYGERQAVNAIIQGSAGDVVRRCMVRAHDEFPEFKMLAQVHDEVVWESLADQQYAESLFPDLQYVMEVGHDFDLSVPLKFDPTICASWADKGVDGITWPDGEDDDGDGE